MYTYLVYIHIYIYICVLCYIYMLYICIHMCYIYIYVIYIYIHMLYIYIYMLHIIYICQIVQMVNPLGAASTGYPTISPFLLVGVLVGWLSSQTYLQCSIKKNNWGSNRCLIGIINLFYVDHVPMLKKMNISPDNDHIMIIIGYLPYLQWYNIMSVSLSPDIFYIPHKPW